MSNRYLTKSRFKLAVECPTKLFYVGKPQYPDTKADNEFLRSLAEGGFQVGTLAQMMYPGGIEVTARGHDAQIAETLDLLERDEVTIFEAAIRHGPYFVRVDILRKHGDQWELIEVKAKSVNPNATPLFVGRTGKITTGWLPYLQDIAFQKFVLAQAFPAATIRCSLMLANTSARCTVDGLNQRFKLRRIDGGSDVEVAPGTAEHLGDPILYRAPVDHLVDQVLRSPLEYPGGEAPFDSAAASWATAYASDTAIAPAIGAQCAKCEYRVALTAGQTSQLRSGFEDCWSKALDWKSADFAEPLVLDLYNSRRKQDLIDQRAYKLRQLTQEDIGYEERKEGLSGSQRQWMQIVGPPGGGPFYFDAALYRKRSREWTYPFHFIDFETSRVAVPFHKGARPYGLVAFQFSHHTLEQDGTITHRTEFLQATPGVDPNYEFIRALHRALADTGTVFIWSAHENTCLKELRKQLRKDATPPADAADLAAFIDTLVYDQNQQGTRTMVDLCALASDVYFHPDTKGSSSIKVVLPSVLKASDFVRSKYRAPIYGAPGGIVSRNFKNQAWLDDSPSPNPYAALPPVFVDLPPSEQPADSEDVTIAEGGAAMSAYARLQFEDISPEVRAAIEAALLKYCELDTMAMVMIYEAWEGWT